MEEERNHLKLSPNPGPEGRSELLAQLLGVQLSEAVYIINYLHQSLKLPGDVCEFGVSQGATSALLANEIRGADKLLSASEDEVIVQLPMGVIFLGSSLRSRQGSNP